MARELFVAFVPEHCCQAINVIGEPLMKKMIVSALALALLSGSALAAESKPHHTASMHPTFDTLDTNKDGVISAQEAAGDATLKSNFATLDTDKDGKLSRSEYSKSHS